MFFSATKHCKALPSSGLPKNTEQQLVSAVVVDSRSYAAVGRLLFPSSRRNNRQTPHVLPIKFVKHTTKQMCQRVAQQGHMSDAMCANADRWESRANRRGVTAQSLQRLCEGKLSFCNYYIRISPFYKEVRQGKISKCPSIMILYLDFK